MRFLKNNFNLKCPLVVGNGDAIAFYYPLDDRFLIASVIIIDFSRNAQWYMFLTRWRNYSQK